jgi:hypothetical protein
VLLVSAAGSVANALERLGDSDLDDNDRETVTAALRAHLADVQVVIAVLDAAVCEDDLPAAGLRPDAVEGSHVVVVASRRWRQHRPTGRS